MSRSRSPYGSISGAEGRRRRKRRDDTIRIILGVVLICVLTMVIGFLGVNALRGGKPGKDETKGSNETQGTEAENPTEEEPTEPETPAETEPPYVPVMLNHSHTVWLDAGHGDTDYGSSTWVFDSEGYVLDANGNRVLNSEKDYNTNVVVREKTETLMLTLAIQRELEARGVTVLMTRTDDTFMQVRDRAEACNASNAECFVSIHRNFMEADGSGYFRADISACGILARLVNEITRARIPGKEKDIDLYNCIMDELAQEDTNGINGYLREPTEDDYSVLWRTNVPAVLLEMGYLSNASDNEKYNANIDAYAAAIADGIVTWLNSLD